MPAAAIHSPSNLDNWLEDRGGFTRYAINAEHSYWMCDGCGITDIEEADLDPYERFCPACADAEEHDRSVCNA